ncbi:MGH1-like glycoside hydrolase domain-containing protein [Amycolatopsis sp. PS_44_ISF1]|uniref:MGH1-like glycoside hydrolase domain-containing protein n=1 Tax=Amycolatopsis sp. PS_44_ISF1 TaxID=2974917 RepID=UPI0028DE36A8|nr:glycosyl hydrolase family 65 protein [Amycolatopsis sp. PS_44_ISF1]MDT8913334.1 glycogen debranching protein [Amycolatopsis sp. PS_44_ISF1]
MPGESDRNKVGRRGFLALAGAAGAGAAGLGAPPASAATTAAPGGAARPDDRAPAPRVDYTLPTMVFAGSGTHDRLAALHEAALTDLVGINTAYADPATYDHSGRLAYPPGTFIRAGGGYPAPQRWTRDAAVNAWNAGSLLGPAAGRNTLLSVVDRREDGSLIVQQDNQWWDQVVWILGAWNHYLVTGDRAFLADAYQAGVNTVEARRAAGFATDAGLFEGPAFMNDGIAGYPAPPWRPGIRSSFVLDYPDTAKLRCLSTNCLYHGAFLALAGMAAALGRPGAAHRADAAKLRTAINSRLWHGDAFGYFIHGAGPLAGQLDPSQESAGLAFAVLLGVTDPARTQQVLANAVWEPRGIATSRPHFPLFSDERPGRHNTVVWPMIHSFFGHAAAAAGRADLFGRAVTDLAALVSGAGGGFSEIYDARTGAVQGGWQTGGSGELEHFTSQPDQAWSASGFLRLLYSGLCGLDFTEDGLRFAPCLPEGWDRISLLGVRYRESTVDLVLDGAGTRVTRCTVDGRPARPLLPAHSTGHHTVHLTLA